MPTQGKYSVSYVDWVGKTTSVSLDTITYLEDGTNLVDRATKANSFSNALAQFVTGAMRSETISYNHDYNGSASTPDTGAQKGQEWVFVLQSQSDPAIIERFYLGTADTDEVPAGQLVNIDGVAHIANTGPTSWFAVLKDAIEDFIVMSNGHAATLIDVYFRTR